MRFAGSFGSVCGGGVSVATMIFLYLVELNNVG